MRKFAYIFLTASLLVALIVSTAAPQKRGIVPVPIKDTKGEEVFLYQESHALLVGVSEYKRGWSNLPGVPRDIEAVKVALEQKGFNTIVVNNPTRNQLRDSIEEFINQYGQDVDNRLIFYFAGHGHTMKTSYGEEMGYFVPTDAPNPNQDKSGFFAKSIGMQKIEVYSKDVQSKHALFIFDSCFSGSIFSLSRAIPENISYKTSKPVRQFITAGMANETVPDVSVFNDQFIRALKGEGDLDGDGYLTGVELGEFLNKTVINYTNGSQHPQYGKIRNPNLDKGDFVFSLFDRKHIEKSIDLIVKERKKLEQKRLNLVEEQKQLAALQRMKEEKRKLKEEKRKLKEEQDRLARLQQPLSPPANLSRQRKKILVPPRVKKKNLLKELEKLAKLDATPEEKINPMVRIISTFLIVREHPSIRSKNIHTLSGQAVVPLLQENENWYQVEYQKGKKGWIHKSLSKPIESVKTKLSLADVESSYAALVKEKIYKNWREPLGERYSKETTVSFHIYPQGNIDQPLIKQSSGVEMLDTLALRAVLDSVPFPAFPKELKKSNLFLNIYFKYVPKDNLDHASTPDEITDKEITDKLDYDGLIDKLGSLAEKHGIRELEKN